ncbi:TetR family transcriptional regulator [Parafrankia colletiae]|uniref:TetR family transcriptional regulator n=1 Tax=Parafrankia colletiae TaxID=573497 RepID=A0A1S1R9D2_9ACTN|nr:TetR/AcrR family transcriptional regulator [Parafrankia colletiae]MCK9900103.1 TetR/AcrR family transcriptional regulator [Frankia sp. Cpl3]OHV42349.1 TetR family transcriptional regulator [Parafrankia colletiae]
MTQPARTGRPTRTGSAELEQRLRQAAFEVFCDRGFEAASMEEIARAANITKRTLYAKYPDKRALFTKILPWAMSSLQWDPPLVAVPEGDLRGELMMIAQAAVTRAVDPAIAQLIRMAMSEARRFPEFAQAAHSMAWSPRLRSVIELLERHARAGTIVVDDPELAAEQFLAMVAGFPSILAVFDLRRDNDVEQRHIEHAVELFLSGVEPRPERAPGRR